MASDLPDRSVNKRCAARQISSSGIVLYANGAELGIDVPGGQRGVFPGTPPDFRQMFREHAGEGKLKALLVTHEHEDHFDETAIQRACMDNPYLSVFSTDSVKKQLAAQGVSPEQIYTGTNGGYHIGPFFIEGIETPHSGRQFKNVEHQAFFIQVQERCIVFAGDAEPTPEFFARIGDRKKEIDWFFLPFPYMSRLSVREMMEKFLKISHIWVCHFPDRKADKDHWIESTQTVCADADDTLPMPHFGQIGSPWQLL